MGLNSPWMEDCWGTPGDRDKNQSRDPLQENESQSDGRHTVSKSTGPRKAWIVFR